MLFLGTCEYMGKQYTTGQRWDDGCRYHCQCIDGMSGQYKCDERLVKYHSTVDSILVNLVIFTILYFFHFS